MTKITRIHPTESLLNKKQKTKLDFIHAMCAGTINYSNVTRNNRWKKSSELDFIGIDMSLSGTAIAVSTQIPDGDADALLKYCSVANSMGEHKVINKLKLRKFMKRNYSIKVTVESSSALETEALHTVFQYSNYFVDLPSNRLIGIYLIKQPSHFSSSEVLKLAHIRLCVNAVMHFHFKLMNYKFYLIDEIFKNKALILSHSSASIGRIRSMIKSKKLNPSGLQVKNRILIPHINIEEVNVNSHFVGTRAVALAYDSCMSVSTDYLSWLDNRLSEKNASFRGLLFSLPPSVVAKYSDAVLTRDTITMHHRNASRETIKEFKAVAAETVKRTDERKNADRNVKRSKISALKLLTNSVGGVRQARGLFNKYADDNCADAFAHMKFAGDMYATIDELLPMFQMLGMIEVKDDKYSFGRFWKISINKEELIEKIEMVDSLIKTVLNQHSIDFSSIENSIISGYAKKLLWLDDSIEVSKVPFYITEQIDDSKVIQKMIEDLEAKYNARTVW